MNRKSEIDGIPEFLSGVVDSRFPIPGIDSGSPIVYGATADNIAQDPSLQLAKRVS